MFVLDTIVTLTYQFSVGCGEVCSYPNYSVSWNDIVHLRDDPDIQSNNFCDSWTPWINLQNVASSKNGSEREPFTPVIKEIFCPSLVGGTVTDFRCRDDKGEPFRERNYSMSGDHAFAFSCSINFGVDCYPVIANGTCPDYSYSFYCHCEPATTSSSSTTTATTTTTTTLSIPSKTPSTTQVTKVTATTSLTDYNANGLMCYDCHDMAHPTICDIVKHCTYRQICPNKSEAHSDSCLQCCSDDYCNINGCSDIVLPGRDKRGPMCYSCDHVITPDQCDTVLPCDVDQVCGIEQINWIGLSHYKMGCATRTCAPLDEESVPRIVRRSVSCKHCCNEDYCNNNCTLGYRTGDALIG